MAQIPQINNPITSKNYNYSPRQQDANTEPFDIVKLTGVGGAGVNSDSAAKSRLEMGNRELIPLQVAVAKDPTLAVEMLKDLLNVEVLNQALITGHTELYGSLENLAKELYVTPEQLVQEIVNQEQQNTMFSGHEFYDVLREVAQTTTDPNTKELIGNLLKSINFAQNKNEILGALRANLKFLSDYYSPNEKLSEKLLNLSAEWGADDAENYFDYLKGETLSILKDVSGSLLNDDKTQMLIPLITHNLSRYNNSPYMCKEYFNLLLTQISSGTLRESLKNSFSRLYTAIFDKNPMQDPQNTKTMEQIRDLPDENIPSDERQVSNTNYTTNSSQNQPLSANSVNKNTGFDEIKNEIQHIIKNSDGEFVENADNSRPIFDRDGNFIALQPRQPVFDDGGNRVGFHALPFLIDEQGEPIEQPDVKLYNEYGEEVDLKELLHDENGDPVNIQIPIFNKDGEPIPEKLLNYENFPKAEQLKSAENSAKPENVGAAEQFEDIADPELPQPETPSWHKLLNDMMSERGYMQELKASGYNIEHIISSYTRGRMSGTDALRTIIQGLFVNSEGTDNPEIAQQLDLMTQDFSKINTMQELIDTLNSLLRDMPDIPLRERLFGVFVDIIDKMAVKNELPQHGIRPPVSSTLDNLTEFIEKNINNPALKSLDSFNAANLLQSLLNAPGVFTPLAHYIVPLQVEDTRAFGELWVDNDENNPNNTPGTQRNYHLFLTFDVESIGRFEVDMYALGEEVNLSLLYPPRFEKEIESMKERVTKIIRGSGYQARTFETAPLKKPHNLVEVFPKITDKRTTLNARV
ncbi:MAG: hypothetical protein K2N38_04265 [Oscillospiraceae bacterium]|nr:hypothetical protein [Oscillospiraceae bacterium]